MSKLPEDLRVKLILIASSHGFGVRGQHPIEVVIRLKGVNLSKEEDEALEKVCKIYGVDYKAVKKR